MKAYIVCGTNDSNEPEEFHIFTDYKEAQVFRIEKNSNRKRSDLYYNVHEGELHNKTGFFPMGVSI